MGKYYYVLVTNDSEKEIKEALSNVIETKARYTSGTVITFLKDVAIKSKYKKHHFWGPTEEYTRYENFPMICELQKTKDGKECFVDVITGKAYWATDKCKTKPFPYVVLYGTIELSSSDVVKILKSLSVEEVQRYREAIDNLNYYSQLGYKNYIKRLDDDSFDDDQNDEFIRKFRRTYGK